MSDANCDSLHLKIFTWNISGLNRNKYNLLNLIQSSPEPSFIFLSEPWLHLSDAPLATDLVSPKYCYYLNSEDRHDSLLSLRYSRAHGGTMAFWLKDLDPYVTVLDPPSSRILCIILDKPGYEISAHLTIYLPTAGKDPDFTEELALLEATVDDIFEKYPACSLYIRGDANASLHPRPGSKRDELFSFFVSHNLLNSVPINHPTYHHFMNSGFSDSCIDVLLSSSVTSSGFPNTSTETLLSILCSKTCDLIDSSHDLLISSLDLPPVAKVMETVDTLVAPRVSNTKHRVVWSDEGIVKYKELLHHVLPSLQADYSGNLLPGSASVLLQATNHIFTAAAKYTNKHVDLAAPAKAKKPYTPPEIKAAEKSKKKAHKYLLSVSSDPCLKEDALVAFKAAKSSYQNAVRRHQVHEECLRDQQLNDLLGQDKTIAFRRIKSGKKNLSSSIKSLKVGDRIYSENNVADGFYHSISSLKTLDTITSPSYESFASDYRHIVEISKSSKQIPRISLETALLLLKRIRNSVADFYSMTAAHYLNGGDVAVSHFCFLFNLILENIELAASPELNTAHAVILHKGHDKDRSLDSSYRTISSCPFLAKCIDIYLGDLSKADWNSVQAPTQFQGDGMSHELAALLLTSTIHNSVQSGRPLFVLLLDARSAFDRVLRQILVRRLYLDTTKDQRVLYWDLRLASRQTFCAWDGQLMGPIHDQRGVEQGGPNSSDHYKLYNNEQLREAQESGLGSCLGDLRVAAVGQADDSAVCSNDIHQLQYLLELTRNYCSKYQVELSASKTKLLVFSSKDTDYVKYWKVVSPIHLGPTNIKFVNVAEHVGVTRSTSGNLPHIQQRIASHKKSLCGILYAGLSRRHRANPLSSLKAESTFCSPVLFSGVGSLILSRPEIETLSSYVKTTIENLLKLHPKTPEPFVFLISGTLPAEATLHLKQLSLFLMICRLPENILHAIARQELLSVGSAKTWFGQVEALCYRYALPHPLKLLDEPPERETFKKLAKLKVADFWKQKYVNQIKENNLTSLRFFKPEVCSLLSPHPILSTAGHSYEVNKMVTQLRLLSGRGRLGSLLRHFSPGHSGICELCHGELEDLHHHLVPRCPLLQEQAEVLRVYLKNFLMKSELCLRILEDVLLRSEDDQNLWVQFVLDCSALPTVISASQKDDTVLRNLFGATRTWVYSLHRTRLKLLGLWSK